MLRRFFDANRRLSRRLEQHLPQGRDDLFGEYEQVVAAHMNQKAGQLVVDVGGGKRCPFAKFRQPALGTRIVAVDISEDEIRENRDVDEVRVSDITRYLPFADGEADLVVSRSVLEHLTDLEAFIAESSRVLKPGGWFIHLMPGRYAPFALINRALPKPVARRLLYYFQPQVAGVNGFPAYYDRTYDSALRSLLRRHDFDQVECRLSYYQSRYFDFLLPAYAASAVFEIGARAIGARNLAGYLLVIARKAPASSAITTSCSHQV